jgi:hypothetical protein
MEPYSKFQPTSFDIKGLGLEDRQDWLVCPCGTDRDADILTLANWESQKEILKEFNDEDWETHIFNHWGPGWFEIAIVRPGTPVADEMEKVEGVLSDYPVLDDSRYSLMEYEDKQDTWRRASSKERREWLVKAGLPSKLYRRVRMPSGVECEINVY